jgi:hypothetical protein
MWEVKYLIAFAEAGLANFKSLRKLLNDVLALNSMHIGAFEFLKSF